MTAEQLILVIEQFKNGLMSRATGGSILDSDYKSDRQILIESPLTKDILPQYVKTCRSPDEFWNFIKGKFPSYQERREFLISDFNNIIYSLEQGKPATLSNSESYELGERLGCGGYGEVYKFHHTLLNVDFAVKILDPLFVSDEKNDECSQRFFREAKMLFTLDHHYIVKFYDVGFYMRKPFIRMELVDGFNMAEFVDKYSAVSFERSKKPIIALLEGLSYAHSKGIIHRDLKPSNFMVTPEGKFKIIDFGISAYSEITGHTKLTKTGESVAGGLYTDPCLMQNPKLRDARSDIYSVGAIWYFLLTGRAPSGGDMKEYLLKSAKITSLQADIVMKCLSQDITRRYLTCDELLSKLQPQNARPQIENNFDNRVSEVTRMDMIDFFKDFYNEQMKDHVYNRMDQDVDYDSVFFYHGRKSDVDFLNRIYKLVEMPSAEPRFSNFEEEVICHTIINPNDYPEWWVLNDDRLGLGNGKDETLLRFLSEMFHPAVRKEKSNWQVVLQKINDLLSADGYELYENAKLSNRSIYSFRSIV